MATSRSLTPCSGPGRCSSCPRRRRSTSPASSGSPATIASACCPPAEGGGAAVRAGLAAGRGDVLCYLNWPRTSASSLAEMLRLALRNPKLVLRANRRTRDTRLQRLGSLLYNLECRLLLQIPVWDVNGTPKVFPRCFDRLLALSSQDELLDAEFACV